MLPLAIRPATFADAAACAAAYAPHVLTGTGTFEEVPPTPAEMAARIARVLAAGHPWLVAEMGGAVVGYAYAGQFRDRPGYRYTGETSIYLHPQAIGQGIGRALLATLVAAARDAGFRQLLAVIGDAANRASLALHEGQGFVHAGRVANAGVKFGRWIDIILMQKQLVDLP